VILCVFSLFFYSVIQFRPEKYNKMFVHHQLRNSTNTFYSPFSNSNEDSTGPGKSVLCNSDNINPFSVKIAPWIVTALSKQHPDLIPLYREFFQEFLCGGFYQLCVDVDKFKEEADENQMKIVAMQIYDKYWSPVTQYDVVIKDKLKEDLAKKIDSWNITSDVFDPVIRKLEGECFKKFCMCEKYASFMADRGTYVRTASPRRRLSITDLFVKKGAQGRRSSLGVTAWSPKNSAEIMDLDHGFLEQENGLSIISEEIC